MASKIALKKKEMGWRKKGPTCSNCAYFTLDEIDMYSDFGTFTVKKNKRCNQGGFATGLSNWCRGHDWKD